ncbi:cell division protein ZipA [Coralloluteibacterium stylophorae]|uniref:Cell division protein ZipA n=2 Tax=Coralloluteibacterium stylophorae TaxID=1776034 RepID=A0A8J7VTP5_9GAMM|nr:cell division protein ZipA [Coralloluteibacterium stylophorae]MBS7457531.1 cell division protein ZipA [Coralloluteibacterium stylophorae]
MDQTTLRIILAVAGAILLFAIWWFGRARKPEQGRRVDARRGEARVEREHGRIEPTLGEVLEADMAQDASDGDLGAQSELDLIDSVAAAPEPAPTPASQLGARSEEKFDRIVTLFVAAREGEVLRGPDLVVAAEKAGLTYGHMGIYHRLVDGRPEQDPIFSVASMVQPGNFDMTTVQSMETPGITFFMTLPTPVPALDAWETLLPTAQRMAELLDGVVLDEDRNALGRQRIAHIRDELRGYDREREKQEARRW